MAIGKIKTLFLTDRTLSALLLEIKLFHLYRLNWDRGLHLRILIAFISFL